MAFTAKLKSMFGAQDMTSGKIMDCLIKFSVPLLIGNVAQQLYNTVDSIVVGQYIGDTALAAVGTAGKDNAHSHALGYGVECHGKHHLGGPGECRAGAFGLAVLDVLVGNKCVERKQE